MDFWRVFEHVLAVVGKFLSSPVYEAAEIYARQMERVPPPLNGMAMRCLAWKSILSS